MLNELGDDLHVSSGWPSVTHNSKKGRLEVLDGRNTLQAEFNTFRPHGKFMLPPAWSVNLFYFLFALESKCRTWAPVLRVYRETSPVMGGAIVMMAEEPQLFQIFKPQSELFC